MTGCSKIIGPRRRGADRRREFIRLQVDCRNCCLMPCTSFFGFHSSINNQEKKRGDTRFALDQSSALFADVTGPVCERFRLASNARTDWLFDIVAFVVGSIRRKAMPVILTTPEEVHLWLWHLKSRPFATAALPDGILQVVTVGTRLMVEPSYS